MKNKIFTVAVLVVITFFSFQACKNSGISKGKNELDTLGSLKKYFCKLPVVKFPFQHQICIDDNKLKSAEVNMQEIDSVVLSFFNYMVIGIFPDTTKYYKILAAGPADCMAPMINTFDKNGKLLNSSTIASSDGMQEGRTSTKFIQVLNDKELIVTDSISTFDIDNTGQMKKGTLKKKVEVKKQKITDEGKLEQIQ